MRVRTNSKPIVIRELSGQSRAEWPWHSRSSPKAILNVAKKKHITAKRRASAIMRSHHLTSS